MIKRFILAIVCVGALAQQVVAQPVELLPKEDFANCIIDAHYLMLRMEASQEDMRDAKGNKARTAKVKRGRVQLNHDIKAFQDSSCLGIRLFSAKEALEICLAQPYGITPYCRKYINAAN